MSKTSAYRMAPVHGRVAPSQMRRFLFSNKNAHVRLASQAGADNHNKQEQQYMIDDNPGKVAQIHQPEIDIPKLREKLRVVMENDRLSQAKVAREVTGVAPGTLSQFLADTYPGDNYAVARKLQSWLTAYEDRTSSGGLPDGPEWVETPSSVRVIDCLRYAQIAQDMVLIYGGAGTGKTKGIERYVITAPSVFHVTMTPANSSVIACLDVIAQAVGLREYVRTGSGMYRAICARLRNTNGLLVIDEAQHLGVQALDQIRSIHDAERIGIALVGNEHVYTRMTGGVRAPYLDRLFSRIGKRILLRSSSAADVDAIIKAWGIEDPGCRSQVREIASKPGGLRVLDKTLRLAAAYAKAARRDICCDDVRASWRELGGLE